MDGLYEWLRSFAALASVALSSLAIYWSRSDASKAAMRQLKTEQDARHLSATAQLTSLATRVAAIDEHLRAIPQRGDIDQLHRDIRQLSAEVAEIKGGQTASMRLLDRINTHLMNGG